MYNRPRRPVRILWLQVLGDLVPQPPDVVTEVHPFRLQVLDRKVAWVPEVLQAPQDPVKVDLPGGDLQDACPTPG